MATSELHVHPQSPPRKRAKLSLKLLRKDQHATSGSRISTVAEEPEGKEDESSQCDRVESGLLPDPEPSLPQPMSCIPSEYVITVAPYTGLHNLGNTCYLNSVLQVLRYCPSFTENLEKLSEVAAKDLKEKEEEEEVEDEDDRSRRRKKEFKGQLKLVCKLNKLFQSMSEKEDSYLARMMPAGHELAMYPEDILEAIRDLNPMFKGYLQHDAQELLCCILSNVQEACQRLCEQPNNQAGAKPMSNLTELKPALTSEPCMKAVRKLDMGSGGGVSVLSGGASGDGDRLLGGGRPRSTRRPSSSTTADKLMVKHLEVVGNGGADAPVLNGAGDGLHEDRSERISNGRDGRRDAVATKKGRGGGVVSHPGAISPSNDSVRRRGARKGVLTNGHLPEIKCNGTDFNGHAPLQPNEDGEGGSSKKKRLGMGRVGTFQQSTLGKFGIVKKEKTTSFSNDQDFLLNGTDAFNHLESKPEREPIDTTEGARICVDGSFKSRNKTSNNSNTSGLPLDTTTDSHAGDIDTPKVVQFEDIASKEEEECDVVSESESKDNHIHGNKAAGSTSHASQRLDTACGEIVSQDSEGKGAPWVVLPKEAAVSLESEMQLVERLFQGTLVLQTRCLECEACSEKREDFQDVSVPVQSIPAFSNEDEDDEHVPDVNPRTLSLSWALSEFTSVERLTDDNKYFCEHCFHLTEAERSVLFGRLPGVLIIQLKRFSAFINCFSPGGSVSKVNDHLAIPLTLGLAKWCSSSCSQRDTVFELCSIVAHSGSSSSSGHYVAYARVPQRTTGKQGSPRSDFPSQPQEHCWANFDDDRVQLLSDEDFESMLNPLPGNDCAATPYLLLYRQSHHRHALAPCS